MESATAVSKADMVRVLLGEILEILKGGNVKLACSIVFTFDFGRLGKVEGRGTVRTWR